MEAVARTTTHAAPRRFRYQGRKAVLVRSEFRCASVAHGPQQGLESTLPFGDERADDPIVLEHARNLFVVRAIEPPFDP